MPKELSGIFPKTVGTKNCINQTAGLQHGFGRIQIVKYTIKPFWEKLLFAHGQNLPFQTSKFNEVIEIIKKLGEERNDQDE